MGPMSKEQYEEQLQRQRAADQNDDKSETGSVQSAKRRGQSPVQRKSEQSMVCWSEGTNGGN